MNPITITLGTEQLDRPHTGARIATCVTEQLKSHNLDNRKKIFVLDRGANVISASQILESICPIACKIHCTHSIFTTDIQSDELFAEPL